LTRLDLRLKIHGGILRIAAETAADLLATQRDVVVLHGDMHHENILKFSSRGWLAIDPKGLVGERGFDYANIFCKPRQRDRDHARPLSAANTSGSRGRGIGTQSAAGVESGLGRFVCGI
jgi:streptomycin 6-kinase